MEAKRLKRLEDLLRLGLDESTTEHERRRAVEEALRQVQLERVGLLGDRSLWLEMTIMRREPCDVCGVKINPPQRVFHFGDKFVHKKCFEEGEDEKEADD